MIQKKYSILLRGRLEHIKKTMPNKRHHIMLPYRSHSTYNSIKSKGIDLISSKALQVKISELYDIQLAYIIIDYDRSEWNFNQTDVNPFFMKHFRYELGALNTVLLNRIKI